MRSHVGRVKWLAVLLAAAWALPAAAESDAERRARLEVESELEEVAPYPDGRLQIRLEPPPGPGFVLAEADWFLDGRRLDTPFEDRLRGAKVHPVWSGRLSPGTHEVNVRLRYRVRQPDGPTLDVVVERGARIEVQPGLAVVLRTGLEDLGAKADEERYQLAFRARLRMIAEVDDPEPPEAEREQEGEAAAEPVEPESAPQPE